MKAELAATTVYGEGKHGTLSEAVEVEYREKFKELFYRDMDRAHCTGSFISTAVERPQELLDLVNFLLSNDLFTRFRDVFRGPRDSGERAEYSHGDWDEYTYTLMHLMNDASAFGECVQDYLADRHEAAEHDGQELPEEPEKPEAVGRAISV